MAYIITTDAGNEFRYADSAAYEAALDWYNATSKAEILAWWSEFDQSRRGGPIGEIWSDENCTQLVEDWADIVMSAWHSAEG